MPEQEVKAMRIVIPSFIQQRIATVLLDCTRRVEAYYLQEVFNQLTHILFVHAYPQYLIIKGTLVQIWKSPYMFVFI